MTPKVRWVVTRMKRERSVPKRYQRSGYMAFDTQHHQHGQVWPTRIEAKQDALRLGRMVV